MCFAKIMLAALLVALLPLGAFAASDDFALNVKRFGAKSDKRR